MALTTQQRKENILNQVFQSGQVMVKSLASELSVSEATIRRDLRTLADEKKIELVYGGATLIRNSDFSFRSKQMRNIEGKRVIGRLASEIVSDADLIFIDSGTTGFEMSPFLKMKRELSIIVNSSRLTLELADKPDFNVISLGGRYRPDRMDCVGPLATATLENLRGYIAFIGADGLSIEFGITASDIESAHLYGLAVKNARETILLVDHSKFLSPSLFRIVDWEGISRVITDLKPQLQWTEFLESKGIEILYP